MASARTHRLLPLLFFALTLAWPTRAQEPELVIETGHTGAVESIAFSPDGRILASGSRDKTIKLWDVASGRELRTLKGHTDLIRTVSFSPDGRILASGSSDKTVKLWDVASGRELRTLTGHANYVAAVAFSPNGRILASGSWDNTIKFWDVVSGREIRTLTGHTNIVMSIVFGADGLTLVSASWDNTFKIWDVESGRELRTLSGHRGDIIRCSAFSRDGRTIASGNADASIRLWDVESGRELQTLTGHTDAIDSLDFSPDGRMLASGSWDKTVRLWDVSNGHGLQTLIGYSSVVGSATFSPNGLILASASLNGSIRLSDVAGARDLRTLTGHTDVVHSIAFSPNGRIFASGGWDNTITLWDLSAGREARILSGHTKVILALDFSPDGKTIASGSADGTVKLWEVASGHELRTLVARGTGVSSIAFSPDGRTIASGYWDNVIVLTDVERGSELRTLAGHTKAVGSVAFSPDGRILASGSDDDKIKLWDVATGQELRTLAGHSEYVESVAFSPDGRTLASASADTTIKLWDVASGRELRSLKGHSELVGCVAFSPDGRTLASGSWDRTIKLWDVESGRELTTVTGHTDSIWCVAFSPDGRFFASASGDGSMRFWDAVSRKQLAALFPLGSDDWAIVDSAGRFDASAGGMKLMHWAVGLEPIDLAQLKERYYEPGLLPKVLGYNKEPLRDVAAFNDVKLFPEATARAPAPSSTNLVVDLKNRGGGIGRVQVFVNGKELTADARGPKLNPTAAETSLTVNLAGAPIKPGEANDIRVVTWNQEGYLSSRGVEVTWNPGGDRDLAPPEMYAIVAGISDYSSPPLNLHFASKDAADMARAIDLGARRLLGAGHVHLTLLTSPADKGAVLATKENIREAFEAARKAKPDDILVVYLAGHGVAIQDTYAYPAEDARTLDLADPAVRAQTAISSEEFAEWMKLVPALHQVMIIDTCAAGAAAEKLVEKREVPGDQVRAIERLKDRMGVFVLMGSAADAASYETSQFGQGLLTYALLRGMKGAALRDDQYVDVARLFHNAEDEVPELAHNIGGVQQPRIASPGGASFDIGKLLREDRGEIPLASVKPLLLRPEFLNARLHRDNLGLSAALRTRLREESYASVRGNSASMTAVFVDQDDFPGGISPSGDYTVEGTQVQVTLVLAREDKEIAQVTVAGATDDLNGLAERLAAEIDRILAAQPAPAQ